MRSNILKRVAEDLLSIPPLTFRGIRRRLIKTTLADIDVAITPLHFEIIRLLEEEGTIHVAEIGRRLQIAKAQMTQLIDKLVALNVIEKKIDIADRRTTNISLTDQGRIILEGQKTILMNAIRETMSCLTDKELEDLSYSLRKIRDILSKLQ
jgi:DNA-binding MarR family transcriptional regulator